MTGETRAAYPIEKHRPNSPPSHTPPGPGAGTVDVPVNDLMSADSPRASGEDIAHTQVLAHTDAVLPPILVHRSTLRVIDGTHRLQAAKIKGAETIPVRFFDGDDAAAFVLAVKANIAHGLPLSLADRKAAARRIITSYPQWSDRMIAESTGLTHKTVGAIRRRLPGNVARVQARIGRDGRVRPLDSGDGRLRAGELLRERPEASSEAVGRAAGISPTTVKDVRKRLRRGEDLLPRRQRQDPDGPSRRPRHTDPVSRLQGANRTTLIERLGSDPSIRFTESGRTLLRWLNTGPRTAEETAALAGRVPAHHVSLIAAQARASATLWQHLAEQLDRRNRRFPQDS